MRSLQEHYITLTDDRESKEKWKDEVLTVLKNSYDSIGGIKSNALGTIMNPDLMWKICTRDGKVSAVTISKLLNGTRKVVLAGTDQTSRGKSDLYNIVREDINQSERKMWSEVSGAMEHVYKKNGAQMIPDDISVEVMEILGKHVEPTGDGYHYVRNLGPNKEPTEKVLVGNIDQLKSFIDAAKIAECRRDSYMNTTIAKAKALLESKGYSIERTGGKILRESDTPTTSLERDIRDAVHKIAVDKFGYTESDGEAPWNEYFVIELRDSEDDSDMTIVEVRGEFYGYDAEDTMMEELDKIVQKYDSDAYFEPWDAGILDAYVRKSRVK